MNRTESESVLSARPSKAAAGERSNEKDIVLGVSEGIVYCIRAGQMVPGQHLVESDLTRRFGVSRGSLREALKQLSSDGIVTLTRFRGAFIAVLDREGVRDLLQVLEPLCVLATRLAAEHAELDEDKRRLKRIAADLLRIAEVGGRADYLGHRRLFYDTLIEMGGNSELGRVIPLARTDLFRAQFDTAQTKEQHRRHAAGYLRIAEAVARNDAAKAERAVVRHFDGTRKTLGLLPDHVFALSAS